MSNAENEKNIFLFFNSFADFNYLCPLLLFGKEHQERFRLIFYFEDLKKPNKKIFFKKRKDELLSFPFISKFNPFIAKSKTELKQYLKSIKGVFITTSPSFFQLITKKLLKRQFLLKKIIYIVINYFNEGMDGSFKKMDLLYLNSFVENNGYPANKIRYGNPYWDLFVDKTLDLSQYDKLSFNKRKRNILIPEIMQDGDTWFEDCLNYIKNNYTDERHFWIKYRLKRKDLLVRNKKLEQELSSYKNISHIYSPYFFTTVNLLKHCDDVVFTSNGSLFIMDCMASKSKIVKAYDKSRTNIWNNVEYNNACDDYAEKPDETVKKFINNIGNNSTTLLKEIENL